MATTTAAIRKTDGNRGCGVCAACLMTNTGPFGSAISAPSTSRALGVEASPRSVCNSRSNVVGSTPSGPRQTLGPLRNWNSTPPHCHGRTSFRRRTTMARTFENTRDGVQTNESPDTVGLDSFVKSGTDDFPSQRLRRFGWFRLPTTRVCPMLFPMPRAWNASPDRPSGQQAQPCNKKDGKT